MESERLSITEAVYASLTMNDGRETPRPPIDSGRRSVSRSEMETEDVEHESTTEMMALSSGLRSSAEQSVVRKRYVAEEEQQ